MEWISMEDRLPGNHEKFLVTDGEKMGTAYWDVCDFVGFDEGIHLNPTHWAFLPSFPNQPERSKREDFGFYGTPIIDQLYDDEGNLIQGCGALNTMET